MAASILSRRLANKPRFSHLNSLIHGNTASAPNPSPLAKISPQIHASFSTFGNKFQYQNPSMLENTRNPREITMMPGFARSKYQNNILHGSANFSTKSLISSSSSKVDEEKELKSCDTLHPGITRTENQLRWGFIRKVYGILSAQIGLTAAVASVPVLYPPLAEVFLSNNVMLYSLLASPFALLLPLEAYQYKHPVNLAILGLFTACQGLALGLCCAVTKGPIVLQALTLTSTAVASLTAYTFWASKKGKDFSFLGPFLFSALVGLLGSGILQIWYPLSSPAESVFGAVSALTFSGYIVYNTQELIKRFRYDQYISAALSLYMNILNLFLTILRALSKRR